MLLLSLPIVLGVASALPFCKYDIFKVSYDPPCSSSIPLSCANTSQVSDTCCFESPGGVVLQTQFWDYNPGTGPEDSFTIHGLWPDNCDGTYAQFCDPSREVGNAEMLVESDPNLFRYMKKYWKDYQGNDSSLWEHEFNKHGTCMSTLEPSCYPNYSAQEEALDFYRVTANTFRQLPTYDWLAEDDIWPSKYRTYTKQQIQDSLDRHFGSSVYFSCDDNNALNQVWYFFHVKGSILDQNFRRIDTIPSSGCPDGGIKFPPKISAYLNRQ